MWRLFISFAVFLVLIHRDGVLAGSGKVSVVPKGKASKKARKCKEECPDLGMDEVNAGLASVLNQASEVHKKEEKIYDNLEEYGDVGEDVMEKVKCLKNGKHERQQAVSDVMGGLREENRLALVLEKEKYENKVVQYEKKLALEAQKVCELKKEIQKREALIRDLQKEVVDSRLEVTKIKEESAEKLLEETKRNSEKEKMICSKNVEIQKEKKELVRLNEKLKTLTKQIETEKKIEQDLHEKLDRENLEMIKMNEVVKNKTEIIEALKEKLKCEKVQTCALSSALIDTTKNMNSAAYEADTCRANLIVSENKLEMSRDNQIRDKIISEYEDGICADRQELELQNTIEAERAEEVNNEIYRKESGKCPQVDELKKMEKGALQKILQIAMPFIPKESVGGPMSDDMKKFLEQPSITPSPYCTAPGEPIIPKSSTVVKKSPKLCGFGTKAVKESVKESGVTVLGDDDAPCMPKTLVIGGIGGIAKGTEVYLLPENEKPPTDGVVFQVRKGEKGVKLVKPQNDTSPILPMKKRRQIFKPGCPLCANYPTRTVKMNVDCSGFGPMILSWEKMTKDKSYYRVFLNGNKDKKTVIESGRLNSMLRNFNGHELLQCHTRDNPEHVHLVDASSGVVYSKMGTSKSSPKSSYTIWILSQPIMNYLDSLHFSIIDQHKKLDLVSVKLHDETIINEFIRRFSNLPNVTIYFNQDWKTILADDQFNSLSSTQFYAKKTSEGLFEFFGGPILPGYKSNRLEDIQIDSSSNTLKAVYSANPNIPVWFYITPDATKVLLSVAKIIPNWNMKEVPKL